MNDPISHLSPITRAIYSLREREDWEEPYLHEILAVVSTATQLPVSRIKSSSRMTELVQARFLYYHLARNYTSRGLTAIGYACGGRDHTTVMNGLQRFGKSYCTPKFQEHFTLAQSILSEKFSMKEAA
jgi:chromosomal replication initiator protein